MPIIETIFIITALIALVACWPFIRDLFSDHIIPTIREKLSAAVADGVATLVCWIDAPMTVGRAKLKQSYRYFKRRILGVKTEFIKHGADQVTSRTESHLLNEDGSKVIRIVSEQEMEWESVPPSVREKWMHSGKTQAQLDVREVLDEKLRKQADELDLDLEN